MTTLSYYLVSGALRTKAPLPYYMPDPQQSIRRLVTALREHVHSSEHEPLPFVYYFATLSAIEEIAIELGRLADLTRDLVGVDALFRPTAPSSPSTADTFVPIL